MKTLRQGDKGADVVAGFRLTNGNARSILSSLELVAVAGDADPFT